MVDPRELDELSLDEALGIRSERASGIVRRYSCGCGLVKTRAGLVVQGCLTCPGGDEHARPEPGEQGKLF